jgi:hypothetical protein
MSRVASEMSRDVVLVAPSSSLKSGQGLRSTRDRPLLVLYDDGHFDNNDLTNNAVALQIPELATQADQVRDAVTGAIARALLQKG